MVNEATHSQLAILNSLFAIRNGLLFLKQTVMGLFSRLSRGGRRPRPVGNSLERGRGGDSRQARNRNVAAKASIFLALTAITVAAFQHGEVYEATVEVGDVWQRETLVAPFDFAIFKSEDSLQAERNRVRFTTQPIFHALPEAQDKMAANRDTVAMQLTDIFEAYKNHLFNKSRGRMQEARADSIRYADLRRNTRLKLPQEQWQWLIDDFVARIPDLPGSTREPRLGSPLYEELLNEAWELSAQLNNRGVLDIPRDSVFTPEINVRNIEASTFETRRKDDLYGLNEVYEVVQDFLQERFSDQPEVTNITTAFVRAIFVPSLQYQRGATVRKWQEAQRSILPARGIVSAGDEIIREGGRVTPEIKQQLISYERALLGGTAPQLQWKRTLGQILLALATFAIFFLYLFMVRRSIFDDNPKILLMALLFAGIIGLFAIAVRMDAGVMYAVPVVIVSVVLTVIFDSRVGLFGTLALAFIGGMLLGYDFEFTFATLFGGTLGVFSVRDIKNRGQFFLSAGMVFIGYSVILGASWLFLESSVMLLGSNLLMAGISSFLLIIAYPLLWIFERAFDITTDLTLLELSDTNRPLIKEMGLRSPGTFNHSLQVANLAEAAAAAIGANALLTRVGALYHDIGKMLKPEYFVENQRPGNNPHDQLKPRMSALIIASHVKEGLEMGRQHKLPRRVLDFIPMHHGTTRIEFFYQKALSEQEENNSPLLETDFRYPGPRPQTKETGILMLADGVEAASRSLDDPTHKRLDTLIDIIIKARIEDGQLDETELTFRDLKQIKETFLSLLLGIYHIRVKYPGQQGEATEPTAEEEPDSSKEATEETAPVAATTAPEERPVAALEDTSEEVGAVMISEVAQEEPARLEHPASSTTPSGNGASEQEEAIEKNGDSAEGSGAA